MLTEEQREERRSYLAATDAPVICGLSKWKTPVQLWQEKCRLVAPEDKSNLPWIRAGHYLEEPISQWFSDETGRVCVKDDSLKVHPEVPFIAAHIDRLIKGENAALECKTSRFDYGWGKQGVNEIPENYLVQCVVEAACWDLERVYLAALFGGSDFRYYIYERNQNLEEVVLNRMVDFRKHIESVEPPEPTTGEEVIQLYGNYNDDETVNANREIDLTIHELKEIKETIKEYKEKQKTLEDKIKVYMGKHKAIINDNTVAVTWKKAADSVVFNKEKLLKDDEKLYEKYLETKTGSRRFLVK